MFSLRFRRYCRRLRHYAVTAMIHQRAGSTLHYDDIFRRHYFDAEASRLPSFRNGIT